MSLFHSLYSKQLPVRYTTWVSTLTATIALAARVISALAALRVQRSIIHDVIQLHISFPCHAEAGLGRACHNRRVLVAIRDRATLLHLCESATVARAVRPLVVRPPFHIMATCSAIAEEVLVLQKIDKAVEDRELNFELDAVNCRLVCGLDFVVTGELDCDERNIEGQDCDIDDDQVDKKLS